MALDLTALRTKEGFPFTINQQTYRVGAPRAPGGPEYQAVYLNGENSLYTIMQLERDGRATAVRAPNGTLLRRVLPGGHVAVEANGDVSLGIGVDGAPAIMVCGSGRIHIGGGREQGPGMVIGADGVASLAGAPEGVKVKVLPPCKSRFNLFHKLLLGGLAIAAVYAVWAYSGSGSAGSSKPAPQPRQVLLAKEVRSWRM